jgi:hypothetical protein
MLAGWLPRVAREGACSTRDALVFPATLPVDRLDLGPISHNTFGRRFRATTAGERAGAPSAPLGPTRHAEYGALDATPYTAAMSKHPRSGAANPKRGGGVSGSAKGSDARGQRRLPPAGRRGGNPADQAEREAVAAIAAEIDRLLEGFEARLEAVNRRLDHVLERQA